MRRRQAPVEDAADRERRTAALRVLLPDPRAIDALWPLDPVCAYAAALGRLDLIEAWHAPGATPRHHDRDTPTATPHRRAPTP